MIWSSSGDERGLSETCIFGNCTNAVSCACHLCSLCTQESFADRDPVHAESVPVWNTGQNAVRPCRRRLQNSLSGHFLQWPLMVLLNTLMACVVILCGASRITHNRHLAHRGGYKETRFPRQITGEPPLSESSSTGVGSFRTQLAWWMEHSLFASSKDPNAHREQHFPSSFPSPRVCDGMESEMTFPELIAEDP